MENAINQYRDQKITSNLWKIPYRWRGEMLQSMQPCWLDAGAVEGGSGLQTTGGAAVVVVVVGIGRHWT